MRKFRQSLVIAGAIVALLLLVGYIRLPVAVIKNMADWKDLAKKPTVYTESARLEVSGLQRWWLAREMPNLAEGTAAPRVGVRVRWNALVLARVECNNYIGDLASEQKDYLYIWCFGTWIPIHGFSHVVS